MGPGIHSYTVFVAKDDGPYEEWISLSTDTTAQFIGQAGSEYKFYSIIRLLDGTIEDAPIGYDAITTIETGSVVDVSPKNEVVIYPNPGNSVLHLRQSKQKSLKVRLLTIDGRVVGEASLNRLENTIYVQHLVAGLYFIEVLDANSKVVYRWIKHN